MRPEAKERKKQLRMLSVRSYIRFLRHHGFRKKLWEFNLGDHTGCPIETLQNEQGNSRVNCTPAKGA
jgi:hypothetical protein